MGDLIRTLQQPHEDVFPFYRQETGARAKRLLKVPGEWGEAGKHERKKERAGKEWLGLPKSL